MITRKKKQPTPAGKDGFSLISNEKLLALYTAMLKCRMLVQRTRTHGARLEASIAGTTIDLRPQDAISPVHSSLAPCLLKGVPLKTLFAWRLTQPDAMPRRSASRGVVAPGIDVGTQMESALLAARRNKKNGNIVVLFCDSIKITRGLGLDTLRAAAAERLPILFVCQAKTRKKDFAPQARDYGLPGIVVDGNDVVAVYRVASEAIAHARRGNGPTFIECKPWTLAQAKRSAGHTSDPIRNMEQYLSRKELFRAEDKSELVERFGRELEKADSAAVKKTSMHRSGIC
jgi:TPP-dependent pyruvate/acetoin dehydrogenase alpha subunit